MMTACIFPMYASFIGLPPLDVERFGAIKGSLCRVGINKSDADLLIASTAVELDTVLVADDRALHNGSIDGPCVENWHLP